MINALFHWMMKRNFKKLVRLQQLYFSIYLNKDYADQDFFYERKLHYLKARFVKEMNFSRFVCKKMRNNAIFNDLNDLFCVVISTGSLRYRVKDHATFEIFSVEMNELSTILAHIDKMNELKTQEKLHAIMKRFDDLYETTLQVVSNEPLKFIIFIDELKAAIHLFQKIASEI